MHISRITAGKLGHSVSRSLSNDIPEIAVLERENTRGLQILSTHFLFLVVCLVEA
jgi:hypothetical protein